jgi:hypothetical protein
VEKQLKFDLVSSVRKNKDIIKKYKFDSISNIENNLANENSINIKTFFAICAISNINVIYVTKNTYFENFMNDTQKVYIVSKILQTSKYNFKYGYKNADQESINNIKIKFYEIDKIDKPIKSFTSYKLDDLLTICNKLAIDIVNKDTKKNKNKKDLYELILQYFS